LRIRELRERRGLSPEQLGLIALNHPDPLNATPHDRILARTEIASYESGERWPSWPRIVAMAQILGCDDVLELFEPMPIKRWVRRLDEVEHLYAPQWECGAVQACAQPIPDSSIG
jgi:transcriptional regulator with XRE-family HTH domain